ncbi:MAG: trypsin-like peptidase domain-containing protein [Chloroflexi bacterium]|nr:trypsin-like peptidase domain-containing protein [Chloroflexota bacterium]
MARYLVLLMLVVMLGACAVPTAAPSAPATPSLATPPPSTPGPAAPLPVTASPPPPANSSLVSLPSLAGVVNQVKPAVVAILTEVQQAEGAGSGFIFRPDGYILTNNHVVEGATQITVALPPGSRFPRGTTLPGKVLGQDPLTDTAVVKVEASDLTTLPMARAPLQVGDWVIAVGNALALEGGPTVTLGIVSALGRSVDEETGVTLYDLIQTDAAINPGNSGGPLLNLSGEVVGMNTLVAGGAQGIGFAVSVNTVLSVVDELIRLGKVNWPWIGVTVGSVTPAVASQLGLAVQEGVLIREVSQGSPAERVGLKQNDVIVRLGGVDTPDYLIFLQELRRRRAGDQVELAIRRGNDSLSVTITLAERPPNP